MAPLHDMRFPGETAAYRTARNRLLRAELALDEQVEKVNALRRALPEGSVVPKRYVFEEMTPEGVREVALAELFRPRKPTLVVYGMMYGPKDRLACPLCTSLVDSFNGYAHHIQDRVSFAVIAAAPIARLARLADQRGWHGFPLLSSAKNTFNLDYFAAGPDGEQWPMANVFTRKGRTIRHFWGSEMLFVDRPHQPRHVDRIWPLWNVFDLTPEGRGETWYPKLKY